MIHRSVIDRAELNNKRTELKSAGYEIIPFRSDLMLHVVKLLGYHWGDNIDDNLSLFKWKYLDNINAEHPLGIVALCNGDVVGFRGYFATRFQIYGENDNLIPNRYLNPGSTEAIARDGASRIPNATLRLVPKAGHFVHFEKAEEVNGFISSFLKN